MYVHQYTQHDWSPFAWALMLLAMAVVVFFVMIAFLLLVTRAYGATSAPPPADAGHTEPPAAQQPGAPAPGAPTQPRIAGHP